MKQYVLDPSSCFLCGGDEYPFNSEFYKDKDEDESNP